jgi:hypothetical protein
VTLGIEALFVEGTFFPMGCNDTVALAVFVYRLAIMRRPGGNQRRLTMNILKIALLCSLRVAFFASLKVALLGYTLFLPDTAFASAVPEGNGTAGDTASSARTEAMH